MTFSWVCNTKQWQILGKGRREIPVFFSFFPCSIVLTSYSYSSSAIYISIGSNNIVFLLSSFDLGFPLLHQPLFCHLLTLLTPLWTIFSFKSLCLGLILFPVANSVWYQSCVISRLQSLLCASPLRLQNCLLLSSPCLTNIIKQQVGFKSQWKGVIEAWVWYCASNLTTAIPTSLLSEMEIVAALISLSCFED